MAVMAVMEATREEEALVVTAVMAAYGVEDKGVVNLLFGALEVLAVLALELAQQVKEARGHSPVVTIRAILKLTEVVEVVELTPVVPLLGALVVLPEAD
jgi:hypothetical protein